MHRPHPVHDDRADPTHAHDVCVSQEQYGLHRCEREDGATYGVGEGNVFDSRR